MTIRTSDESDAGHSGNLDRVAPSRAWRTRTRTIVATGGAILVAVTLAGCAPSQSQPTASDSSSSTAEASDTVPLSEGPAESPVTTASSTTAPPIETTTWTTFSSDRYGFSIGHPSDWTVLPADHDWTMAVDADPWQTTGMETFLSPTGDVAVGAWSAPAQPGETIAETSAGVEAWVEQYCQLTNNGPCTGVGDRGVPLCNERRDCHPGLLVPFGSDVQAFFTGGNYQDVIVIVAVWRPETHPSVEPYGGSRRLLEAFLSTMGVCPARLKHSAAGCPAAHE